MIRTISLVAICLLALHIDDADAQLVVDLNTGFAHGQQLTSGSNIGPLVTVSSPGTNSLGMAIFDTNETLTLDSDLEVNRGNALMFQNNLSPSINNGIYTNPNDDPQGGVISFDFTSPFTMQSIDLIDIDIGVTATVTLTSGSMTRTYLVPENWTGQVGDDDGGGTLKGWDPLNLMTLSDQAGSTGLLATASEDSGFDPTGVTRMVVNLTGSGAMNNITLVPEPGSFTLFATACLGLIYRRRSI